MKKTLVISLENFLSKNLNWNTPWNLLEMPTCMTSSPWKLSYMDHGVVYIWTKME